MKEAEEKEGQARSLRRELEMTKEERVALASALEEARVRGAEEERRAQGEMQEVLRSLEAMEAERDRLSTQLAR